MKGVHVSLDIEACGEVLLSVGACVFDPLTGETGGEFYVSLEPAPQMAAGLRMDAGAFDWWLKQSEAARAALFRSRFSPVNALTALREWMPRDAWLWAYPTSYDLPVIERVCRAYGIKCPWSWKRTMCGRTLWTLACWNDPAMAHIERDANPTAHDALGDAKEQAGWYARYLKAVTGAVSVGETTPE